MTAVGMTASPRPAAPPVAARPATAPIQRIVELAQGLGTPGEVRITPMPGGASTRQFFRLQIRGGAGAVAMFVPDATRPEEVSAVDERGRRWPFLEIRELLEARGVRVPRLLAEDCDAGVLLVEDLGDATVAEYLARRPNRTVAIYQRAIADLAAAQSALADLPVGSIVAERAFEPGLLEWEIQHFREWALEARGIALPAADRATFDRIAARIAGEIASWPRGFVHRDYQSRNLMVLGEPDAESLGWVDFQDALMGPRAYDLVALLQDSYQSFDDAFIAARLDEYAAHRGLGANERTRVQREFFMISVQRKLKDAGRFVFIEHKKGDASYLPFVEPTIAKVRRALDRLAGEADFAELAALLDRALGS